MYRKLQRTFNRIYRPLKSLVIILTVWAIKEAFTRLAWSCPCLTYSTSDWWYGRSARQLYGILYIVVPFCAFWMIGIFLQESTWRCITGWRVQEKFVYPGRSCFCFFWTLGSNSLAPITWLFFVFLDGRYLECIQAVTPEVCQLPGTLNSEIAKIHVISQVTAFGIAVICLALYAIVRLLSACCGSMTYYQLKHAQHIMEMEENTFYQASEEYHTNEMKKKWKTLFAAGSESDWDTVSELVPNDPIKKKKHTHYTPFQNWNGVVAPNSIMRQNNFNDSTDINAVTIIVKSNNENAQIDVKKPGGDIWTSDRHVKDDGRGLPTIPHPVMPPMTYGGNPHHLDSHSPINHNGDALYPTFPNSRDGDKYSLMPYEETFKSSLGVTGTSTPIVKKKKVGKRKNKVKDTD